MPTPPILPFDDQNEPIALGHAIIATVSILMGVLERCKAQATPWNPSLYDLEGWSVVVEEYDVSEYTDDDDRGVGACVVLKHEPTGKRWLAFATPPEDAHDARMMAAILDAGIVEARRNDAWVAKVVSALHPGGSKHTD